MPVSKQQAESDDRFHFAARCSSTTGPRGGVKTTVEVWRRNGETKLWKTRPTEFRVPIKFGQRSYSYLDQGNAHEFHTEAECPLGLI